MNITYAVQHKASGLFYPYVTKTGGSRKPCPPLSEWVPAGFQLRFFPNPKAAHACIRFLPIPSDFTVRMIKYEVL